MINCRDDANSAVLQLLRKLETLGQKLPSTFMFEVIATQRGSVSCKIDEGFKIAAAQDMTVAPHTFRNEVSARPPHGRSTTASCCKT